MYVSCVSGGCLRVVGASLHFGFLGVRGGLTRILTLSLAHFRPIYKAVNVVDKKGDKAYHHGYIRYVIDGRQHPQYNEDYVVGSVCQRVEGAAAEGEICGDKTRRHRYGAGDHVRRVQRVQNEPERRRHRGGKCGKEDVFSAFQFVHFDFAVSARIGVSEPRYYGEYGDGRGHAEIGDHLAVVGIGVGDDAVEDAEHHDEQLSHRVAFGSENEGCRAHKRGGEGEDVLAVEHAERHAY